MTVKVCNAGLCGREAEWGIGPHFYCKEHYYDMLDYYDRKEG